MTANRERTELPASGREGNLSAVGQHGIAARAGGALRVVSADESTVIPNRSKLSLGSSGLPIPPSSPDISTLSGPLDLSYPPAGLERPEPDASFFPEESDADVTADPGSRDPAGFLDDRAAPAASRGSAQFETRRTPIGLESQLEGKTDSRGALTDGRACLEPSSERSQGPSSVEMKRTGFDSRLARTIDAWPSLPVHVRETIVTIIDATLNG
jgi:hypothetical protein